MYVNSYNSIDMFIGHCLPNHKKHYIEARTQPTPFHNSKHLMSKFVSTRLIFIIEELLTKIHRTVNEIPRDMALNILPCGNDSQSCSSCCSCCHTGSRHNGSCRNLDSRCNIGSGSNFEDTHSCMILFTYIINKSLKKIHKQKRIKRPQPAPPQKKSKTKNRTLHKK